MFPVMRFGGASRWCQKSPFSRIGDPDEVAAVAAFLASDAARWVTAQNVAAGGGAF